VSDLIASSLVGLLIDYITVLRMLSDKRMVVPQSKKWYVRE
jgi:hypothetical protein